jgi:hypothetical protein
MFIGRARPGRLDSSGSRPSRDAAGKEATAVMIVDTFTITFSIAMAIGVGRLSRAGASVPVRRVERVGTVGPAEIPVPSEADRAGTPGAEEGVLLDEERGVGRCREGSPDAGSPAAGPRR